MAADATSRAAFELRASTTGLERDIAEAVEIHRQGARAMVQVYDQFGQRVRGPLDGVDSGLKSLARTSRGLAGPLVSELGPAFDGVGIRIAHVLTASTSLATGMNALVIAGVGVAGVLGGALLASLKKDTEEATNFQNALNSVDTGKIQGEMDRLIKKLDEAAVKIRFLQGPAGQPPNRAAAPLGMTTDFPDITGPITSGEAARDAALADLARAREQLKGAAIGEGEANLKQIPEMIGKDAVAARDAAEKRDQDLTAAGLASMLKAIDDEQDAAIAAAAVELRLDEERNAREQTFLDAGLKAQLAAIDEEEARLIDAAAVEMRLDEERFKQEQDLIDRGLAAQLRAIDEAQDADIADARQSMALDEERFRRVTEQRDEVVALFSDVNTGVASAVASVTSGTQTVSKAFEAMGRSIVSSITENAINKGLKLLEDKLFELLQTIAKTGLSAYLGLSSGPTMGPAATDTAAVDYTTLAYQHGGVATHPQIATIAEAGAEAIVPLSGGRSIPVDLHGVGGGGGNTVEINIYNQAPDTEVEQKRRQGDAGQTIYDIVIRQIKKGLATGELDGAFSASFGLRRATVGR